MVTQHFWYFSTAEGLISQYEHPPGVFSADGIKGCDCSHLSILVTDAQNCTQARQSPSTEAGKMTSSQHTATSAATGFFSFMKAMKMFDVQSRTTISTSSSLSSRLFIFEFKGDSQRGTKFLLPSSR